MVKCFKLQFFWVIYGFGWNDRADAEIAMVGAPQIGALDLDFVAIVAVNLDDLGLELVAVDVVVYLELVDYAIVGL